jgi:O-succinylbenzoic acid--CoA ligase
MDLELLTDKAFWRDKSAVAAGDFPGEIPPDPRLAGHVLFETSGSSGEPKWIALSKNALLASADAVNRHLGVTAASCWGLALPLRHVGGFGVAARSHVAGCRVAAFPGRWQAAAFVDFLTSNHVTHTSLVPTQVFDLVTAGLRAPLALQAVVVGGGFMDMQTGCAARALGWPVLASYGMTEAASQVATQPLSALASPYRPAPLPLLPIWRAELSPQGTLRLAGPALFSGTVEKNHTAWEFRARNSVWHETSDRVRLENGMLTPLGRADALVKVLGELVDPAAIEQELLALANGALAPGSFVIVAVPDARSEHALVPVFDAAVDPAWLAGLLARHAADTPAFRRLRAPLLLADFPRSSLGKPLRAEIVARILRVG